MMFACAIFACLILALLGGIHLYWALGGRVSRDGAIPSINGKALLAPTSAVTALVGIALFAMSGLVGATAGLFATPIPPGVLRVATGLLALVFFARGIGDFRYVGFFKRVKGSLFATRDTYVYSPLCMVLAVLAGVVTAQ
jgi:hypothetical protein